MASAQDFDRVTAAFKRWYTINLEHKEHSLRGWNWGKAEFGKYELAFNVQSRPAFEIAYTEIQNTNLAGKNEVAVELAMPAHDDDTGTNGHLGGARAKGKKSGGARDELVEMRFYIPGTVTKREKKEDGEEVTDGEDGEEQNAANTFYDTLMDKAEIGEVAGDTYATFLDILHLTPRSAFHNLVENCTNGLAEAVSISQCMRSRFGLGARLTTTKFNTIRSRSSWSCQSPTSYTC